MPVDPGARRKAIRRCVSNILDLANRLAKIAAIIFNDNREACFLKSLDAIDS